MFELLKKTSKIFSKVVVPFYIPTSSIWDFWHFHILTNTYYVQSFNFSYSSKVVEWHPPALWHLAKDWGQERPTPHSDIICQRDHICLYCRYCFFVSERRPWWLLSLQGAISIIQGITMGSWGWMVWAQGVWKPLFPGKSLSSEQSLMVYSMSWGRHFLSTEAYKQLMAIRCGLVTPESMRGSC